MKKLRFCVISIQNQSFLLYVAFTQSFNKCFLFCTQPGLQMRGGRA